MGLDSFWRHHTGKNALHPEFVPELNLVGGIFSEHGKGSFRGKAYYLNIREITGVDLHQEKIPNKTIKKMAKQLEENEELLAGFIADDLTGSWEEIESRGKQEAHDLVRMFKAYGKMGFHLVGWW